MRGVLACFVCLWVVACGIFGPDLETPNRALLDPVPAEYPGWYVEVVSCLAQLGDYDAIVWYVADEVVVDGVQKAGILKFPNTITMRAGSIHNQTSVRHEMVHHVRQVGDELHDTNDFASCS